MTKYTSAGTGVARLYGSILGNIVFSIKNCQPFFNVTWSLIALALLLLPFMATAQVKTKKVLGSFVYKGTAYNYEFKKNDVNNYTFTLSSVTGATSDAIKATANIKAPVTITNNNATPVTTSVVANANISANENYIFDEFNKDVFIDVFCKQMSAKFSCVIDDTLKRKSLEVFFTVQRNLDFLDDEPVTAHLILKKDDINSFLISNTSPYYDYSLSEIKVSHKIKDVNVETEDGAIKNIIVYLVDPAPEEGKTARGALEFKNAYPISISGKHDPERFAQIKLNCYDCAGIQGLNRYIKLSDLLELDITLENDKEDYSPANITFNINPEKSVVEMRKEKRSQIISIAAFSDFVGIDQEQPNGLIQIEAKRKVNINTKYRPLYKRKEGQDIASKYDLSKYDFIRVKPKGISKGTPEYIKYYVILKDKTPNYQIRKKVITDSLDALDINRKLLTGELVVAIDSSENKPFKPGYFVWMPSIEPKLLFSKIDDKNRFIMLDSTQSAGKHTDPLKQFQYQLVSFGTTINLLKIVYPQSKLSWNLLDLGAFWYRARVQNIKDTSTNISMSINNAYFSASSSLTFKPDSRWSFTNGLSYFKQQSFNTEYQFQRNKGLLQANFDGSYKTNSESKMFFRFRWTFDEHDPNKNFTQFQVGYALNLFANSSTTN